MMMIFSDLLGSNASDQITPDRIAAATDKGLTRPHNEDDFLSLALPGDKITLAVVTDGMGGHDGGELASYFTIEALSKIWRGFGSTEHKARDSEELLVDAIKKLNSRIHSVNDQLQISRAMGTTITAGLITPSKMIVAHVGDSRAYFCRGGKVKQITEDHTWVAKMVKLGNLSRAEAENHPLSHLLSNCIGASPVVEVSVYHHKRKVDDRYLFCTDGLYGSMSPKELQRIMKAHENPRDTLKELIYCALRGGGKDNITGIVLFDA